MVCDSNGSLINLGLQRATRKWEVKTLEAKAILEGIKLIVSTCEKNQIPLEIESDSIVVVKSLAGDSEDLTEMKLFTDEILSLS